MNKNGGEEAIDLIGTLGVEEVDHAAHVLHAVDLGAQVSVGVKVAAHEVAVLERAHDALALYADAARSTDDLAVHVLVLLHRRVDNARRLLAHRPARDVVRPTLGIRIAAKTIFSQEDIE